MKEFGLGRIYSKFWDGCSVVLLILVLVIIVLQVLMRYVFNAPLLWTEESSRYAFIWMALIVAVIAMRDDKHICIDLIDRAKSKGFLVAVNVFQKIVTAAVLLVIFYFGCRLVIQNRSYTGILLPINMGFVNSCIPLGSLGMLIYLFAAKKEGGS